MARAIYSVNIASAQAENREILVTFVLQILYLQNYRCRFQEVIPNFAYSLKVFFVVKRIQNIILLIKKIKKKKKKGKLSMLFKMGF